MIKILRMRSITLNLALILITSFPLLTGNAKSLTLNPIFEESKNGIFEKDNEIHFSFVLHNDTDKEVKASLFWQVYTDQNELINQSVPEKIEISANKKRSIRYTAKISNPGFYKGTLNCSWGNEKLTRTVQVGYSPLSILPPLTREPDFQVFWENAIKDLKSVPPKFQLIHQPLLSKGNLNVYEVIMHSYGNVRVKGWYEVPKTKGPHPVILRVPGYGGNLKPINLYDDMIVFSFNPRGHGNSQDDIKGTPKNFWVRGLDNKKDYYYKGAYMDCVRAVDFLCSRGEVDSERIAIKGGSQGGGLSLSTAALDQRIDLCIPHIPFLTNWELYFKTSKWPEMDEWIEEKESRSWEGTLRTLSYFDTMNMASMIHCPVFMGVGLQDAICPPVTNFAIYNHLSGKKEYRVYPYAKHSVKDEFHSLTFSWARKYFGLSPNN